MGEVDQRSTQRPFVVDLSHALLLDIGTSIRRKMAPASAVVRVSIEPGVGAVAMQESAKDQFCVPAVVLKGDSCRLKGKGKGGAGLRVEPLRVSSFQPADLSIFQPALTRIHT